MSQQVRIDLDCIVPYVTLVKPGTWQISYGKITFCMGRPSEQCDDSKIVPFAREKISWYKTQNCCFLRLCGESYDGFCVAWLPS